MQKGADREARALSKALRRRLRDQNGRAGRGAAFERDLRLRSIRELVAGVHGDLDRTRADDREKYFMTP